MDGPREDETAMINMIMPNSRTPPTTPRSVFVGKPVEPTGSTSCDGNALLTGSLTGRLDSAPVSSPCPSGDPQRLQYVWSARPSSPQLAHVVIASGGTVSTTGGASGLISMKPVSLSCQPPSTASTTAGVVITISPATGFSQLNNS